MRICHPHTVREECATDAMWRNVSAREREAYALVTAELMAFPDQFEAAMRRAIREWPRSVEHAFTNPTMNHRAWLGHAGCFLATGSPEDATRLGWHRLDGGQQHAANEAAQRVIDDWKAARRLAWTRSRYGGTDMQLAIFADA